MFLTLLQKEIHDNLLGLRFAVAMILCLILIPLGMYINLKDYEKRLNSYEQSSIIYMQDHPTQNSVSKGGKAFRKPSPLSIFSIGLEYYFPTTIHSDPQDGISFSNDRGINNAQSMLSGKIDLVFNVSVVISLLAILFTFNCISGEKEMGTLKLILSNNVPRHTVIISKLAGNFIVLFIPYLIALLIGIIILVLSGKVPLFSASHFPYFISMMLVSFLVIAVFFNLGLLVSSLTQRSSTAIIILLLLWVIGALAFPRISTMIAEVIYPVKSDMVHSLGKKAALGSLEDSERADYKTLWDRIGDPGGFPDATPDSTRWSAQTKQFMHDRKEIKKRYASLRMSSITNVEINHQNHKQQQSVIAKYLPSLSGELLYICHEYFCRNRIDG